MAMSKWMSQSMNPQVKTKVCIMDGYTSKQQMVLKIGKKYSAFIHNKGEMSGKTLIMWMIEYGWLSD